MSEVVDITVLEATPVAVTIATGERGPAGPPDATERARAEAAETSKLAKSANLSDVASVPTARTNLGLGTAATHAATDFDAAGVASAAQVAAEAASDKAGAAKAEREVEKTRAEAAEATKATPAEVKAEETRAKAAEKAAREAAEGASDPVGSAATERVRAEATETLKAPLASPALTGTPTVPTAVPKTNTTQAASTAFAQKTREEAEAASDSSGTSIAGVKVERERAEAAEVLKAPLASPALTGTPKAPTAANKTNTEQLATTAFVQKTREEAEAASDKAGAATTEQARAESVEASKAPLASPALTGAPTAPTAAEGDNSTKLSTTAYADRAADEGREDAEAASDKAGEAKTERERAEAAEATKAQGFTPTAVKTAAYVVVAGDYVRVDISGGSVPSTLPTEPPDKTRVGVKVVKISGTPGSTTATIVCGGTDVFNVTGGSTTLTLSALFQSVILQYQASGKIWTVQTTDTPLGGALGAAKLGTDGTVGGPSGSVLSASVVSRRAGDALTAGYDSFTGKGTSNPTNADSGQAYTKIDNGAAGAALSVIGGFLTNTAATAGVAAGYWELPSPGEPVVRISTDVAFSPGTYAFTAKTAKSATLTEVSSFTGLAVGMGVTGKNIPAATTIIELKPGTKEVVMSAEATVEEAAVAVTATATAGGTALLIAWNEPFSLPVTVATDCHVIVSPLGWQWGIWRVVEGVGVYTILSPSAGGNNPWAPGFVWPTFPNTAHFEIEIAKGVGTLLGPDGVAYSVSDSRIGEKPGYYPMPEVYQGVSRSDRKPYFADWAFDTPRTNDLEGKQNQPSYSSIVSYLGKSIGYAIGEGTNTVRGQEAGRGGEQNTVAGYRCAPNIAGKRNVIEGYLAAYAGTATGEGNVISGFQAAYNITSANFGVVLGFEAGHALTTATANLVGYRAGYSITTATACNAMGKEALFSNKTGTSNNAVGNGAFFTTLGEKNSGIGHEIFKENEGSGNAGLGYQAGFKEKGSNKLYIANTNTAEPLIWGDFSAKEVRLYTTKIGLYGVAPTARAAAIAEPAETVAGLKAAVNSIRTALKNIGITE